MLQLKEDLEKAKKIIENSDRSEESDEFDFIYHNANDNLKFILRDIDVKDKNILSVLASSDALFSFIYKNAKNVDTFDVNKLNLYYYYLRKWCLEQQEVYLYNKKNQEIKEILEKVNCRDQEEKIVKTFWEELLEKYDNLMQSDLFYNLLYHSSVPYTENIEELKRKLKDKDINFKEINMFLPIEDATRQYDMIYLSNILEYSSLFRDFDICRENIDKLLKNKGLVVCSEFKKNSMDKYIFDENFSLYKSRLGVYKVYQKK